MLEIVVATRNPFKVEEIRRILVGLPVQLRCLGDFSGVPPVAEDGRTFEENAIIKVRAAMKLTGAALADDSGLEVDALGGEPGVHSARWAGMPDASGNPGTVETTTWITGSGTQQSMSAANNSRLVAELREIPEEKRTGRYVCVVALGRPGWPIQTFRGTVEGRLIAEARGTNGFGYDPYFFYPPFDQTFGEASAVQKDAVSHRGGALRLMRQELERMLREKV